MVTLHSTTPYMWYAQCIANTISMNPKRCMLKMVRG